MVSSKNATVRLLRYCSEMQWERLDVNKIHDFVVKQKADLNLYLPQMAQPVLHEFCSRGLVAAFQVCMESPHTLNFTVGDSIQRTAFHILCLYHVPETAACEMLRLMVYRLQTHPLDIVDWGKVTLQTYYDNFPNIRKGYDFLSYAALYGRVGLFWPEVRDMPYYADTVDPIDLCGWVWESDWRRLTHVQDHVAREQQDVEYNGKDQFLFNPKQVIPASPSTAGLFQLLVECDWREPQEKGGISLERVQEYAREKANVMFQPPKFPHPILCALVSRGNFQVASACLDPDYQVPIDLTTTRENHGDNVLDCLCRYGWIPAFPFSIKAKSIFQSEEEKSRKQQEEIEFLQRLVDYVEIQPESKIDWEKTKEGGILQSAASFSKLSLYWPLLKRLSPFSHQKKSSLYIRVKVYPEDWSRLSSKDQQSFILRCGFREDSSVYFRY